MISSITPGFWHGRRVFLTGHTGFKGAWLTAWLKSMGADVYGFSLPPGYSRSPYELAQFSSRMFETLADVNDAQQLHSAMAKADPHVVFHLAAQPLVRYGYRQPVETFATNVMGTVNLLSGLVGCPALEAVVVVTTDKCYRNEELDSGYTEDHPLGGYDPYSSSKACAELVAQSWYQSFMSEGARGGPGIGLATARAGNVVGGGDWSEDRLIPDVLRALEQGRGPEIRNPDAVRPWQYVLDPLAGYLMLAEKLAAEPQSFSGPWNFGPNRDDAKPVGDLVEKLLQRLSPDTDWRYAADSKMHETSKLYLDCSKAHARLGWRPRFSLDHSLDRIVAWHLCAANNNDLSALMTEEVSGYAGHPQLEIK